MKIVVLISSLYTGGAEFSTLLFYGWLKAQGYQIKLVCYKRAHPSYDPSLFGFGDFTVLEGARFIDKLNHLNSIVSNFKPLLLHSVLFEANILGRFSRLTNKKVVYLESLVNEVYSPLRLKDPKVSRFKLKAYQLFDAVTQYFGTDHFHANGESVANHYYKKLRIKPEKVTVIPRGRNENCFIGNHVTRQAIRKELGISDECILLVNVGRHEFQKGHDLLIEAVSKMNLSSVPYFFVIAGREGNMTGRLTSMVSSLKLNGRVSLIGHRTDISQLLAAADVFVFPSRFEGLPGSLIEAEAAALPIVCSAIPNNEEVVCDGLNALLFQPGDVSQLAQHLVLMVTDPRKRQVMGEKSLEIFMQRFTLDTVHGRMKGLIDRLSATR